MNNNSNNNNNELEKLDLPRLLNESLQPTDNITNQISTIPNNNSSLNTKTENTTTQLKLFSPSINQLNNNENITYTPSKKINKKKIFKYITITLSLILLFIISITLYCSTQTQKHEKIIKQIAKENNTALENALKPSINTIKYNSNWTSKGLIDYLINTNQIDSNINIELYVDNKKISNTDTISFNNTGRVNISIVLIEQYNYKILTKKTKDITTKKDISLLVNNSNYPIIYGISNKSIALGSEIDILEGISAFDEKDGILKVQTEGFVDFNKVGEYIIKVFAINKDGNKTEEEMKITIFEEATNNSNSNQSNKPSNENNSSTNNSQNNNSSLNNNYPSNDNSQSNNNSSSSGSSSSSSSSSSGSSSSSEDNSSSSNKPKPEVTPPNPLDKDTKDGRLRLATIEARLVAKKIFTDNMTDLEKANAIVDYLFNNVTLLTGQTSEDYKINFGNEAYGALILKAASSPGFCHAVILLCEEGNLKCEHINKNQWSYQWVSVEMDGKIYSILADQGWLLDYDFGY